MTQPKYYDVVLVVFVAALLCSNLIGPGKACDLGGATVAVGSLFFPLTYIASDVLTEVYGFSRARRAIWLGFFVMLFGAVVSHVVVKLPVANEPYSLELQSSLEFVFGNTFRVVCASIIAFVVGDFTNAYVLVQIRRITGVRHLWMRTIGSTVIGQALDSAIFFPIAFAGVWTTSTILSVVFWNWIIKVWVEILMTPLTYRAVALLRRSESGFVRDASTDFSPFRL